MLVFTLERSPMSDGIVIIIIIIIIKPLFIKEGST